MLSYHANKDYSNCATNLTQTQNALLASERSVDSTNQPVHRETLLYRNCEARTSGDAKGLNVGLYHYLLQEENSIAHHGWVVDNVKAVFEFLHCGFLQQFVIHTKTLRVNILLEHTGCPQTTHHSCYVLVVLLVCLVTEPELHRFLRGKKTNQ